jgi:glutamine cyclotransferase
MKILVHFLSLLLINLSFTSSINFIKLRTFSHDENCFTQGLVIYNDTIIETCGLKGKSSIRMVNSSNGKIIKEKKLNKFYFAEGLAVINDIAYVLTWKNKVLLLIDLSSFEIISTKKFTTYNKVLYFYY